MEEVEADQDERVTERKKLNPSQSDNKEKR